MMDLDSLIRRKAESMQKFAGEAPAFQYGEYKAWEQVCIREGRTIPPEEFRAWPDDKRHPPAGERGHAQMTSYGQLTAQQIRYWAKEAREKYGLDMIYAETQEEADALNAKYKPKIPYVTGVVYYAEPIDGVEHKPALSRFYEAAKSPD